MNAKTLRVGLAQIAPQLLDRAGTLEKVLQRCTEAADAGCGLVAFGEALVPGYPIWTCRTGGARFDADDQKQMHARYLDQAVQIDQGHLQPLQELAARHSMAVILGTMERAADRGGHSLYCSRVFILADGTIGSVHRKLMPTHEERLSWAPGDGAGLRVHEVGPFSVGALNCWENWMPLARAALYAQGENLHVALWPGSPENTGDITRFVARESRSYVLSVCGMLRSEDIPDAVPLRDAMLAGGELLLRGGSAIAGPDGNWLQEPVCDQESLLVHDLDLQRVYEERQNFDPSGHYSRPDVLRLKVDFQRQSVLEPEDDPE